VFTFLLLLLVFAISALYNLTNWGFLEPLSFLLLLWLLIYLYAGMKRFYKQGWFKTFLKFMLVSVLSLIMMLVLFLSFLLLSVFTF